MNIGMNKAGAQKENLRNTAFNEPQGKKWKDEPDVFSSKDNIFNVIPLRGEINLSELLKNS